MIYLRNNSLLLESSWNKKPLGSPSSLVHPLEYKIPASIISNSVPKSIAILFSTFHKIDLDPPGLSFGTEICLGPGGENNGTLLVSVDVRKGKWKGSRSTNHGSSGCVLLKEGKQNHGMSIV